MIGKDSKLNVLFVIVDDYRDYASFLDGHPNIKTPNLDRFIQSATLFDNAHCQATMCGPSRASLFTGILPSSSGCYGFQPWRDISVLEESDTIPGLFKQNGYIVKGTGKIFHGLGPTEGAREKDWDEYWPSINKPAIKYHGAVPSFPKKLGNLKYGASNIDDEDCGDYKHASWIIDQLSYDHDKPFFLGLGLFRPHLPFVVPKKYFELYNDIDLSVTVQEDMSKIPHAGLFWTNRRLFKYIKKNNLEEEIIKSYMACVSFMDAQMGRVMDALENSKYNENTIVVFCGDNGFHLGEKQHWKKFTLWKEATRVPLIIKVPKLSKELPCHRPVSLIDIYPTLIELCNLKPPNQKLEGRSLVPLIEDSNRAWDVPALTTHGRNTHALTFEDWKYIRYFDGSEELYDLRVDRKEWNNLAKLPQYRLMIDKFQKYLPEINIPNCPGTKVKMYFSSDYPDIQAWEKRHINWLNSMGKN